MIVFIHGVPEIASIWREVQDAVDGESVALSLPGFGCPVPDGFPATKDAYVEWLLGELDDIGGPVDLVGHDWGAGLVYRVASAHGDRIRSWAADVGNIVHPDYVWHDLAQVWQTPGDGEAFVEAQAAGSAEEGAPVFESMGVPSSYALEMAAAIDATMGACILSLYRSAVPNPYADWGPWAPTSAPGLVLHPTEDPFSEAAPAREVATMFGARYDEIPGAGHFWPCQAPAEGAAVLESFWASLPA